MKIEYISNEKFIIYVNKYYYSYSKDTIKDFIMNILKIIKKKHNIDIYSLFKIICYKYDLYGMIMVINRKNDTFYKYAKKTEIDIKIIDDIFLFEIDDYFLNNKVDGKLYIYNNKYYIELNEYDLNIVEHINKIIFGDEVIRIKNM